MNSTAAQPRCKDFDSIQNFDQHCDVLVCGFGGAGGAAALEARLAGAEVIVLERASAGGGSTAMSSCEMYLGGSGGTRLQQDLGFSDSTENMIAYLEAALGHYGDSEKIRLYCEGAAAHFDWAESLGVHFKRSALLDRVVVPLTDESLLYTGNERSHPFNTIAEPVPRGHVPSMEGDAGGRLFMDALIEQVETSGCQIQTDTRVTALLIDNNGRVRGVTARQNNREIAIEARRGVVLSSGGFVMNQEMTRRYLPDIHHYAVPYGNSYDMGDGILLGMAAGARTINMDQAFMSMPVYPPAKLTNGILINEQGQRFINEDAYLARLAHFSAQQSSQRVFLLVQNEDYEPSYYLEKLELVAVDDSIAALEQAAELPPGSLVDTVERYNQFANANQPSDPVFHKHADWIKPLNKPPYALISYAFADTTAVIMPGTRGPLMFTLGGLETRPSGEVINTDGGVIAGLFAAGRVTAGLPRTSAGYASGMSVGDATFFGRLAGQSAAAN